jgi:hypothetical protein
VSDGYWISKLGRPVVVVVQKVFEVAAKTQAKVLGASNLPICAYPATPVGADIEPVAADLAARVAAVLRDPKQQAANG